MSSAAVSDDYVYLLADDILKYFFSFFFRRKQVLTLHSNFLQQETIRMKFQIPFLEKIRK